MESDNTHIYAKNTSYLKERGTEDGWEIKRGKIKYQVFVCMRKDLW